MRIRKKKLRQENESEKSRRRDNEQLMEEFSLLLIIFHGPCPYCGTDTELSGFNARWARP